MANHSETVAKRLRYNGGDNDAVLLRYTTHSPVYALLGYSFNATIIGSIADLRLWEPPRPLASTLTIWYAHTS